MEIEIVPLNIYEGQSVPFPQSLHSIQDSRFLINGKPANIVDFDEQSGQATLASLLKFPTDSFTPLILRTTSVGGQVFIVTISLGGLLCLFNGTGQLRMFSGQLGDLFDTVSTTGDKWKALFQQDPDNCITAMACLSSNSGVHLLIGCKRNLLLSIQGSIGKTRVTILPQDLHVVNLKSVDNQRPLNDEISFILPMKLSNHFITFHSSGLLQCWQVEGPSQHIKPMSFRTDLPYMITCATVCRSDSIVIVGHDGGQIVLYSLSRDAMKLVRLAQINAHAGCITTLDTIELDGKLYLASTAEDHVVSLWQISFDVGAAIDIKLLKSEYHPKFIPTGLLIKQSNFEGSQCVSIIITGMR